MARKNIAQILIEAQINEKIEYQRLFDMFYNCTFGCGPKVLADVCKESFWSMPFRDTCISLDDFNDFHGFHFVKDPDRFCHDYLITFCEYTFNLLLGVDNIFQINTVRSMYFDQLYRVIEKLGYDFITSKNGLEILVPQNANSVAVAEIVDTNLSYSILEYNHHSLKGDLTKKKTLLKFMADDIEPQRKILNGINKTLSDNLFRMLQKFVRHNNTDNTCISSLTTEDIETCYDDIYQMWLLAKLEIDNLDRKKRVEEILRRIAD